MRIFFRCFIVLACIACGCDSAASGCSAYVRFVNALTPAATGLSESRISKTFFAMNNEGYTQFTDALGREAMVGPYIGVQAGYIDVRAYSSSGTLMVRRGFMAAGSAEYTVALVYMGGRMDFVVVEDASRRSAAGKFKGVHYNFSGRTLDAEIVRLDGQHPVTYNYTVLPYKASEYLSLDLGIYGVLCDFVYLGARNAAQRHTLIFNALSNNAVFDLFTFDSDGGALLQVVPTYFRIEENDCIKLHSVRY